MGSHPSGVLHKVNESFTQFKRYQHEPANPNSLADGEISTIFIDRSNILWIGTRNRILTKFEIEKEKFTHYRHDPANPKSKGGAYFYPIYEDKSDNLWVGGGLNRFDRQSATFTHFIHEPGNKQSISNNYIQAILEDESGRFRVGTKYGLNLFNREKNEFSSITLDKGWVSSIFEDRAGVV